MTFVPQFDENVYIANPYYGAQRVNPQMCATLDSAFQLAALLPDLKPKVIMAKVFPTAAGSPFDDGKVPYLLFPSGLSLLAGILQMWWVRNPTPDGLALANCKLQIVAEEAALTVQNGN